MNINAIILAAGRGTRMKSSLPKVMHNISGIPMVEKVVRTLEKIGVQNIIVVTGHGAETIENHFDEGRVTFVRQNEQLGTAHAVMTASPLLKRKSGRTLVLTGDTPLLNSDTLEGLLNKAEGFDGVVLTTVQENPFGYGRIIRDSNDNVIDIVEEKDATKEQKRIHEVNTGIFCFDNESLFSLLSEVKNENSQNEYYLTDIVSVFNKNNKSFSSYTTENPFEVVGINDRLQLHAAETYNQNEIKKKHMLNGVTFLQAETVFIEEDVVIENDVTIEGNVNLKGRTIIASNAMIGSGSDISNSIIGNDTVIRSSVIHDSELGSRVNVGPFAHIRPLSVIGNEARVGNFVEIKKSTIGEASNVSHLSYIGDAEVGKGVNIGCGSITVNYDGGNKYKTVIEDGAFVGCNVNLIAPITIGEGSIVAAGSTITNDVPSDSLAIARERQVNKEGYAKNKQ